MVSISCCILSILSNWSRWITILRIHSAKRRCSGSTPLGASTQNLRDPTHMSAGLFNFLDKSRAFLSLSLPLQVKGWMAIESLESNMAGLMRE